MAGSEAPKAGTGQITMHMLHDSACNAAALQLEASLALCSAVQCSAVKRSSASNCKSEHHIGTSHLPELRCSVPCCLMFM